MLGRYLEKRIPAQIKLIVPHQSWGDHVKKAPRRLLAKKMITQIHVIYLLMR